jgi:hypothetical protein
VRRYAEFIRKEYSCRHSSQRKKLVSAGVECGDVPGLLLARPSPLIQTLYMDPLHRPSNIRKQNAIRRAMYRHLHGEMSLPRVSTSSCPEKHIRQIRSSVSPSLSFSSSFSHTNSSSVSSSTYGDRGPTLDGDSDIGSSVSMHGGCRGC